MKKLFFFVSLLTLLTIMTLFAGADSLEVTFSYNGEILTHIQSTAETDKVTMPDYPECQGVPVGWVSSLDNKLYPSKAKVTIAGKSADFSLFTVDLKAVPGVSVRVKEGEMGLRFAASVSKHDFDKLYEYVGSLTTGSIIYPIENGKNSNKETHSSLMSQRLRFCDIITQRWSNVSDDNSVYSWYSAIRITDSERCFSEFVCIPYILYYTENGEKQYIYAEVSKDTNCKSVYDVSILAFEDRDPSYKHSIPDSVNSNYSKEQLSVLKRNIDRNIWIEPQKDGSVAGRIPQPLQILKYYKFPYIAQFANGTLTIYSSDGTTSLPEKDAKILFGEGIYDMPDFNGKSYVNINVGNGFDAIRANQIGYRPDSVKRAIVTNGGNIFWIVNANTGTIEYAGTVEMGGYDKNAGENVNYCDFSEFTTPGTYVICVDADTSRLSYPFKIADDVYDDAHSLVLKCFYYNRCGCAVKDDTYNLFHSACHKGNAKVLTFTGDHVLTETGETVTSDLLGGWHDAGDYGRYSTWEAGAVSRMMIAYRLNPSAFTDATGIPESSNNIPDILDEARYTLEWLIKMQRADGAVYHKLTSMQHAGNVSPEYDNLQFYLFPVSSEASAFSAGALAMGYRVFRDIDPDFAAKCLDSAKLAYEWAAANETEAKYPFKDGSGTGIAASNNIKHDLAYASVALYMSTGEERYHDSFAKYVSECTNIADSPTVCALFDYIINEEGMAQSEESIKLIRSLVSEYAKNEYKNYESTYYEFAYCLSWFSNMSLAGGRSTMLILDEMYNGADNRMLIEENFNYVLGKNATGYCGLVGRGYQQIQHPHLRFWTPGWVVGGPTEYSSLKGRFGNYLLNDTRLSENMPPLKCYVDDSYYFFMAEPTINGLSSVLINLTYLTK